MSIKNLVICVHPKCKDRLIDFDSKTERLRHYNTGHELRHFDDFRDSILDNNQYQELRVEQNKLYEDWQYQMITKFTTLLNQYLNNLKKRDLTNNVSNLIKKISKKDINDLKNNSYFDQLIQIGLEKDEKVKEQVLKSRKIIEKEQQEVTKRIENLFENLLEENLIENQLKAKNDNLIKEQQRNKKLEVEVEKLQRQVLNLEDELSFNKLEYEEQIQDLKEQFKYTVPKKIDLNYEAAKKSQISIKQLKD